MFDIFIIVIPSLLMLGISICRLDFNAAIGHFMIMCWLLICSYVLIVQAVQTCIDESLSKF